MNPEPLASQERAGPWGHAPRHCATEPRPQVWCGIPNSVPLSHSPRVYPTKPGPQTLPLSHFSRVWTGSAFLPLCKQGCEVARARSAGISCSSCSPGRESPLCLAGVADERGGFKENGEPPSRASNRDAEMWSRQVTALADAGIGATSGGADEGRECWDDTDLQTQLESLQTSSEAIDRVSFVSLCISVCLCVCLSV